ncbi:MAG TPA: hypothetical protein VOA88_16935 [Candidatus Dormibacteraeota bacterium]|nr:hypothetical protein [Candidatus Dormibacteraeota bacterium]
MWGLLQRLGGTEIGHVKLPEIKEHWKSLLFALFDDIFGVTMLRVIFFWDELPLFINNVQSSCGEKEAMELLDALRALRQKYANLRMVFTGSVGIHQVIGTLRKHGYANDPTNDMVTIEVPPLQPADGTLLAELLLEGEGVEAVDGARTTGDAISSAAGHIPYYIQYLVSTIRNSTDKVCSGEIQKYLDGLIADPNDAAHFDYYQTRLTTYYGAREAALALQALDVIAVNDRAMGFNELFNLVKHKNSSADDELCRQVLQVLLKDHYLVRAPNGTYTFRHSIVQRWWAFTRG